MAHIDPTRPLSPHLQVYHWYFTMFLSILHRATGVALSVGLAVLTWWLFAGLSGAEAFARFHDCAQSIIGQVFLLGWLFSLSFHTLNGLRHLMWDTGHGLSIKEAYTSGLIVFIGAFIMTALIWCYAG